MTFDNIFVFLLCHSMFFFFSIYSSIDCHCIFVCIYFVCADTYLLHLLINKSRDHLPEICLYIVYEQAQIFQINHMILEKVVKLCFWMHSTLGLYLFSYSFEMWLSILQVMAEKKVSKEKKKQPRISIGNWQANKRLNTLFGSRFSKVKEIFIQERKKSQP